MASFTRPELQEIIARIQEDLRTNLSGSSPSSDGILMALATSLGIKLDEMYDAYGDLIFNFFEELGIARNIIRAGALPGEGKVAFEGTLTTTIPAETEMQIDGLRYNSTVDSTVSNQIFNVPIGNLVAQSGLVTVTLPDAEHLLASGFTVTVQGADPVWLNGLFIITVIDQNVFTYNVDNITAVTSSTVATIRSINAVVSVRSVNSGAENKQPFDVDAFLTNNLVGINRIGRVTGEGILGAADRESEAEYKFRVGQAFAKPGTAFNAARIEEHIKNLPFIDEVYIFEANDGTSSNSGHVYIIFTTKNNIIPDSLELLLVRQQVLTIKDSNMPDANVHIEPPVLKPQGYAFDETALVPNTPLIKDSIRKNLADYTNSKEPGADLLIVEMETLLNNLVDVNGVRLTAYTLLTPSSDVTVNNNELPRFDGVDFLVP